MSPVTVKPRGWVSLLLLITAMAAPGRAQSAPSTVMVDPESGVRVIDGDTFEARINGNLLAVGLLGVRAARVNTPCGELARAVTFSLLNLPGVRLEPDETFVLDSHYRRFYYVLTSDGRSVASELVRAGLARSTGKGRESNSLADDESQAKENNRGCINDFPVDKDERKEQYLAVTNGGELTGIVRRQGRLPAAFAVPEGLSPQLLAHFDEPAGFARLPDGSLLIAERAGRVLLVKNGSAAPTVFADVRDRVNAYWNRGISGIATDPEFATNGFVYVLHTYENDPEDYSGPKTQQVLRLKAVGDAASTAPQDIVPIVGRLAGASCDLLPVGSDCIPEHDPGLVAAEISFDSGGAMSPGNTRYSTAAADYASATAGAIRINAGGPAYTDPQGNTWEADIGYSGGRTYAVTTSIANTTMPTLYQSERFNTGPLTYAFAVPNGNYTVNLKFAELWYTTAGKRSFNVSINDQTVHTNFDVVVEAGGAKRAVDRSHRVAVTNGQIAIQFAPVVENPKVNAIEIIPDSSVGVAVSPSSVSAGPSQSQQFTATVTGSTNTAVTWSISPNAGTITSTGLYTAPATITTAQTVTVTATSQADATKSATATITLRPEQSAFTPIRINAGGPSYTDPNGNVWAADNGFSGGRTYSVTTSIANTTTPTLYQTERFNSGPLTYTFTVPNGTYTVTLKFAELWFTSAARRVFDIVLNGQTVEMNFDVFSEAGGAKRATDRSYTVSVTNGHLAIQLTQVIENPKVNAIAIVQGGQAVNVSVSPGTAARGPSQTQQFMASVTGTSNTAVNWSINPNVGTINASGLYTAPSTITSEQTVTVRAVSQQDPTRSATATVTLLPAATFVWTTRAPSPIGRMEAQGAIANGKLYVFGGFTTGWTVVTNRADVYDPATNTWTRIADVPEQLTHSAVVVDGDTIYLIGGYVGGHPGPSSPRVWKYNTVLNQWDAGPALPGTRGGGAAPRVGRFVYFFGGATRSAGQLDDTDQPASYRLALDGGTAWTRIADMPNPRNHLGGAVVDGKVYAIGGQHEHDEGPGNQVEVDRYEPENDRWTRVADLPTPRGHIAVVELDRRILVMGNGPATAEVSLYDPAANVWLKMPSLPQARASAVAGVVNGSVIVATGHPGNGVASTTTWNGVFTAKWESATSMPIALGEVAGGIIGRTLYLLGEGNTATLAHNLSTGMWSSTLPSRPHAGHHHAAEVLDGKLYLIGGLGGGSEGKVQIFDPAANSWTLGANMPFAAGSSSSAVINGEIFVAGGIIGSSSTTLAAAYNPATNTWRSTAPMPRGLNHAASATDGSKLYVFGGRSGGNVVGNGEDTIQVYNPTSNTWLSNLTGTLAPLPQGRGGMGKAAYADGEFYVIGGETLNGPGATPDRVYNRVDIYNPAANTWRSGTPMPTARHGIFPLAVGGRIYVAGGGVVAGHSSSVKLEILNIR